MQVAIVGCSHLNQNNEMDVKKSILIILKKYSNDTIIISGGAKGVDSIASDLAKELGFQIKIYKPEKEEWNYYRQRNLKIAENCDELYCITIKALSKKSWCYHHKPKQDHQKTAGCHTANSCKQMKKPTHLIIV